MNRSKNPNRFRIGIDFHTWDGIFQGSRSHILGLYKEAVKQAPDITFVFFLNDVESLKKTHPEFSLPNVELVKVAHTSGIYRLAFQMPWLQIKYKIDLLHMQYRLPFFRFGPCACTIHDVLFETHPQFFKSNFIFHARITSKIAAKKSAILFTVSNFSKEEISRLYDVVKSKIYITYNGVDRNRFFPSTGSPEKATIFGLQANNYILSVGRYEPRKNHESLIRAYANLDKFAPPLVIVGQKDFSYQKIFTTISELNLQDRVHLLQNIDDSDLPELIRNASLFVYPSFAEGFGMPVAEAMASGVPVITSNITALPEVCGEAAILISPNSIDEMTAALVKVLSEPNTKEKLINAGLEQAIKFDWKHSAKILIEAIRERFLPPPLQNSINVNEASLSLSTSQTDS